PHSSWGRLPGSGRTSAVLVPVVVAILGLSIGLSIGSHITLVRGRRAGSLGRTDLARRLARAVFGRLRCAGRGDVRLYRGGTAMPLPGNGAVGRGRGYPLRRLGVGCGAGASLARLF